MKCTAMNSLVYVCVCVCVTSNKHRHIRKHLQTIRTLYELARVQMVHTLCMILYRFDIGELLSMKNGAARVRNSF